VRSAGRSFTVAISVRIAALWRPLGIERHFQEQP
jgi:hypothetical protein